MENPIKTLLDTTILVEATDGSATSGVTVGVNAYRAATFQLTVSDKTFDGGTTLNVYIQRSVDGGTTWDDLVSFAQMTNSAVGDGAYIAEVNGVPVASLVDRVTTDGTLSANTLRSTPLGERLRVKYTWANVAGTDTVTIKVTGCFYR
jgi:hypothetical protein